MAKDRDVVCFTCGQALGTPLRVNTLPSGTPCPTCRDRVLEALPSLLPRRQDAPRTEETEIELGSTWEPGADDDDPMPA